MRNLGFILACFWALGGCASASFAVGATDAAVDEPADDAGPVGTPKADAAGDAGVDSAPLVCDEYSCQPGCGECDKDAGMACGHSGPYLCGSQNCGRNLTNLDAGFPCATPGLPSLYTCQGVANDVLPGCVYSGTGMNQRWYCCR